MVQRLLYLPPPTQKVCKPMIRQHTATHGLSLSPILAAFQKSPLSPVRYGSMSWGAFILT